MSGPEHESTDALLLQLIGEATLAGAYRELAREHPAGAVAWAKMADRHSRRVLELATEIARRGGEPA